MQLICYDKVSLHDMLYNSHSSIAEYIGRPAADPQS